MVIGLVPVFDNLTQTKITLEDKTSVEELSPSDFPIGKSMGAFLKLVLWEDLAH